MLTACFLAGMKTAGERALTLFIRLEGLSSFSSSNIFLMKVTDELSRHRQTILIIVRVRVASDHFVRQIKRDRFIHQYIDARASEFSL